MATKTFDVIVADSVRMAEVYQKEFGVVPALLRMGDARESSDPNLIDAMGVRRMSITWLSVGCPRQQR